MRTIQGALVAGFMAFTACAHGAADPEPPPRETGWNVAPFRPQLTSDKAPELCEPFAAVWTGQFDGTGRMDSSDLDLSGFPSDALLIFPERTGDERKDRGGSLYSEKFEARLDLDGDGDREVLLIVGEDSSWRYSGASMFVFDTEEEFEILFDEYRANATYDEKTDHYYPAWTLAQLAGQTVSHPLIRFGPLRRVQIIQYEGALYTVSDAGSVPGRVRGNPNHETLRRIWPAEEAETVCEIQIRPEPEQFEPFISASPFYQALKAMYAGPERGGMCYGTMGWTGVPPEAILPDLFYRPQAWPEPNGRFGPEEAPQDDVARQLRPLSWGASDPVSWQVYLSLKKDQPEFLRRMREYYEDRFGMEPEAADAAALRAWRALTDRVFYARNNDMPLAFLVTNSADPADFSFDAPVDAILAEVEAKAGQVEHIPRHQVGAMGWAISAATLAGRPAETVIGLYKDLMERQGAPANLREERWRAMELARIHDMILPAASTRPDVLAMLLPLGVPASGPTNAFGKTMLMYAAQADKVESVRLLLDAGVEVNAQTGPPKGQEIAYRCSRLERDHRTALMYAAENASADLISLLLDAGADAAAMDTQGNGVSWYLARNVILDEDARARLEARLALP
jgi:hypothetical protein